MPLWLHPRGTGDLRPRHYSMVDLRRSFQCEWRDSSANRLARRAVNGTHGGVDSSPPSRGFDRGRCVVEPLSGIHCWLDGLVQNTTAFTEGPGPHESVP